MRGWRAIEEALAEEAFEVFSRARNQIDLYDDVLPGLALLKDRYRLSTASNGNADLAKVGIAHWFERSVSAREVGALKPDPTIFRKVIEGTDLQMSRGAVCRRRSGARCGGRAQCRNAHRMDQPQ